MALIFTGFPVAAIPISGPVLVPVRVEMTVT
jgi:hypothetical protein